MRRITSTLAIALCLFALPALAADCENPIRSFTAPDGVTGVPLRIQWSLGGLLPQSQTLSGHDFAEPVVLSPSHTTFVYVPDDPGEKHLTLSVVTECGTFTREVKYHVQQCNVATPILTVDKPSVEAGGTVTATVDLPPGHTARWVVRNGTPSATEGESIQITAAPSGQMRIDVFVKRGDQSSASCEKRSSQFVSIHPACSIQEPEIFYATPNPTPNSIFYLVVAFLGPDETATFAVTNATVNYMDGQFIEVMTPATGTFSIDVTVSKPGCSKTYPHTWEVVPCEPAAVVSVAGTSCDANTIAVDFTGTAPFQGYWSDNQYFYTMENRLERTVTVPGTYTLSYFLDARCLGTVSGEAVVAASLPTPAFTVEEMVNGWWYGGTTCPGLVRSASLTTPIPDGAEVIWSIENGTILSGQGTATIQWSGTNPGPNALTAVFRNADGCTSEYVYPYILLTQGVPEVAVTVEPSTIDAGGTAIVTVTHLNNYTTGWSVYSSLGDLIYGIGPVDESSYRFEYRSTQGAGVATIIVDANNMCGQSATATTTLTINQGAPVQATATIRLYGDNCENYTVGAELTGIAPFSGTWSNGQTFVSDYPFVSLYAPRPGTYTLTEFSDANGPGTITGSATVDFIDLPTPQFTFSTDTACPNAVVTATLTTPVPEGATVQWSTWDATILSGQGTPSIQLQVGPTYGVNMNVKVTAPGACSPWGFNYLPVTSYVQEPLFDLYGVYAGASTDIWVTLDPNTATWAFENTLGDPMELLSSPWPNTYIVRYTSTHGAGQSTVRVYGTTTCGTPFEASRVMTVYPPAPTITLTSTHAEFCGAIVTATLTGTAPFTVTWNDTGETVTTNENTVTHFVTGSRYLSATVVDANGGMNFSDYVLVDAKMPPQPSLSFDNYYVCPNGTVTATATGIPEGAVPFWYIFEPNARIVSGQGTNQIVVEATAPGWFGISVRYSTPEGCDSNGVGMYIEALAPAANPVINLPVTSIAAGESFDFTVAFDGNYQSLNWESSNGDAIYSVGQDGMTFTLRYTSYNGPGTTTIRAYGTTLCGQQVEAAATLTINP